MMVNRILFVLVCLIIFAEKNDGQKPLTPKFSGIHFDVEPYTLGEPELNEQFVELLVKVKTLLDSSPHQLKLSVAIPFFYDESWIIRDNENKTVLEWVMDVADKVSVLAYRDFATGERNSLYNVSANGRTDSSFLLSKEELEYGEISNTKVEIIMETICGEPFITTFCEEDTTYLEQQFADLHNAASKSSSFIGKGLHSFSSWKNKEPTYNITDESCSSKRSLYVWEEQDITNNATLREELFAFAKSHAVNTMMFHSYFSLMNSDNWPKLEVILREAYEQGIQVEALYGAPEWARTDTHGFVLNVVQTTLDFVDSIYPAVPPPLQCDDNPIPIQLPTSMTWSFDIHTTPEWTDNQNKTANEYLDALEIVRAGMKNSPNTKLSTITPFWYDTIPVNRNLQTKPLHEWILDIVDRVLIYSSRDWAIGNRDNSTSPKTDSITFLLKEEFEYAEKVKKEVVVIVPTSPDEGFLTFYDNTTNYMEQEIDKLEAFYSNLSSFGGVAFSSYSSLAEMQPAYTRAKNSSRPRIMLTSNMLPIRDTDYRDALINFCVNRGVTDIIVNAQGSVSMSTVWQSLRDFSLNAYNKQLRMEWLLGLPELGLASGHSELDDINRLGMEWIRVLPLAIPPYSDSMETLTTTGVSTEEASETVDTVDTSTEIVVPTNQTSDSIIDEPSSSKSNKAAIIGGVVGGCVGLCLIIAVIVVLLIRKKSRKGNNDLELSVHKSSSEAPDLRESGSTDYNTIPSPSKTSSPGSSVVHSNNASNMSLPPRGTLKNEWVIKFAEISIEKEIGRGAFGVVYKGKWRATPVAVKKMIVEGMNSKEIQDFNNEISLMKNLRPSPNVVILIGVCEEPLCVVTEFYERGNLLNFLSSDKLTQEVRRKIAIGIARGMLHLHLESIIHRDLAARNVLLGSEYEPKISDFGLSRVASSTDGGKTESNVGPLLWMAPESINHLSYSTASDVWAFGITMIELYTGKTPYDELGKSPVQIASLIMRNELKPAIPSNVPKPLAEVMGMCFEFEPSNRPDFSTICSKLEKEL